MDEVSIFIQAAPERVWELVSDVRRMGEWSPECFRCMWLGRRRGPVPGARFVGFNRRGFVCWPTLNRVEQAERGRSFLFLTTTSGVRWGYRMEPVDDGTELVEHRDTSHSKRWVVKPFAELLLGGEDRHADELRAGMRQTLERIKAAAEA